MKFKNVASKIIFLSLPLLGMEKSKEVVIKTHNMSRNKGCGKRFKRTREIAIEKSKKSKRFAAIAVVETFMIYELAGRLRREIHQMSKQLLKVSLHNRISHLNIYLLVVFDFCYSNNAIGSPLFYCFQILEFYNGIISLNISIQHIESLYFKGKQSTLMPQWLKQSLHSFSW